MPGRVRVAVKGGRTVYVEHGIWWDPRTRGIHVTAANYHWVVRYGERMFASYRRVLVGAGRWPVDAVEYEAKAKAKAKAKAGEPIKVDI